MDDVFELLRQRAGGFGRTVIDVLFACLDAVEGAVEAIDLTGAEALAHPTFIHVQSKGRPTP
ncbi:hypothetical protein ABVK25_012138 [Lepraria finkii]|uniref:Uncharacterized protein n=1 Tax=Lepraria finkii TaxID=1340010 RepID=A0ABR4AKM0_9LECA